MFTQYYGKFVKILKLLILKLNDCKCNFKHCIIYAVFMRSRQVVKHLILADVLV